jgi:hypothetical protein
MIFFLYKRRCHEKEKQDTTAYKLDDVSTAWEEGRVNVAQASISGK